MKSRLLIPAALLLTLAACDNSASKQTEEQRRELERQAAEQGERERALDQREADQLAAEQELQRKQVAEQQAAIDADRQRLAEERAAARDDAAKLARIRAEEQRIAEREAAMRAEAQRRAEEQAKRDDRERKLDLFFSALDPLGDWTEIEPYGYCWQPREAQGPGWRPYTDGSWAYTDYGWTWKSDEPFGWATYHYGRWARVRRVGWVWVPGSEWAPAWVAWRRGGEYVGWAPLPPEAHSGHGFDSAVDSYFDIGPASYIFVPVARLGETSYRTAAVAPERNVTIINNTVNITRISYTTVDNKSVIFNGGPDFAQINSAAQRPVPKLSIQRVSQMPPAGGKGTTVVGNVLRIVAPRITSASRPAGQPAKFKQKVKSAEVERGWEAGNPQELEAVRERNRREASEAEQKARAPQPAAPKAPRPLPAPTESQPPPAREPSARPPQQPPPRPSAPPAPAHPTGLPPRPGASPTPMRFPEVPPRASAPDSPAPAADRDTPPAAAPRPRNLPPPGSANRPAVSPSGIRKSTPPPRPPMTPIPPRATTPLGAAPAGDARAPRGKVGPQVATPLPRKAPAPPSDSEPPKSQP